MERQPLTVWPFLVSKSNYSRGYRLIAAPDFMLHNESASRLMTQTNGDLNRIYVRVLLDEVKPENSVTVIYRIRYPLTEAGEKMLVDSGRGFTITEGVVIQGKVETVELTHLSLDKIFDETNAMFMNFFQSDRGKTPIKETAARPITYGTSEIALLIQPPAGREEYGITQQSGTSQDQMNVPKVDEKRESSPTDPSLLGSITKIPEILVESVIDFVGDVIGLAIDVIENFKSGTACNEPTPPDHDDANPTKGNSHHFSRATQVTTAGVGAASIAGSVAVLRRPQKHLWDWAVFGFSGLAGLSAFILAVSHEAQRIVLDHLTDPFNRLLIQQVKSEDSTAKSPVEIPDR